MAGKKGAAIQLQAEVNTEEEWVSLLEKTGLTVADIYSDWCGPCTAMVEILKKVKMTAPGADILNLAIVKNDEIECLERFRTKSKPTWMFISGGLMVNLMFGAMAPKLRELILEELDHELKLQAGEKREGIPCDELAPEEKAAFERAEEARLEKIAEEEAEAERIKAAERLRYFKNIIKNVTNRTVILLLPFAFSEEEKLDCFNKVMDKLLPLEYSVVDQVTANIDAEFAGELFFHGQQQASEDLVAELEKGDCLIKVVDRDVFGGMPVEPSLLEVLDEAGVEEEPEEQEEEAAAAGARPDALEEVAAAIYGIYDAEDLTAVTPDSPAAIFAKADDVPAMWTPRTTIAKATVMDKFLPKFCDQFRIPKPPPIPPHVCMMFSFNKKDDLEELVKTEALESNIIKSAFFSTRDPETAKRVCLTGDEYNRLKQKTGEEHIVMMVNRVKSDTVLALAQMAPVYISPSVEQGEKDGVDFFGPQREDDEDEFDLYTQEELEELQLQEAQRLEAEAQAAAEEQARLEAEKAEQERLKAEASTAEF